MREVFFILIWIISLSCVTFAQKDNSSCNKIKIIAPERVSPGDLFEVSADFDGNKNVDKKKLSWKIIKGKEFFEEKGKDTIQIDSKNLEDNDNKIIVLAEFADQTCQNTAIAKINVVIACGLISPIDIYSKLDWEDEKARLDVIKFFLKTEEDLKNSNVVVSLKFEKNTSPTLVRNRLSKLSNYLLGMFSANKEIITFAISKESEERTEITIYPKEIGVNIESFCDNCLIIKAEKLDAIQQLFQPTLSKKRKK